MMMMQTHNMTIWNQAPPTNITNTPLPRKGGIWRHNNKTITPTGISNNSLYDLELFQSAIQIKSNAVTNRISTDERFHTNLINVITLSGIYEKLHR